MIHYIQVITFRTFLVLLIVAVFLMVKETSAKGVAAVSPGATIQCESAEDTGKGLSKVQEIKTLTRLFWQVIEKEIGQLPPVLQSKGWVVGDFHTANLGLYYDVKSNTTNLMVNDYDDTGHNFLLGDLIKFLVFVKREYKGIKYEPVINAYFSGLNGRYLPEPIEILQIREEVQRNFREPLKRADKLLTKATEERSSRPALVKPSKADLELVTQEILPLLARQNLVVKDLKNDWWLEVENSGSSKDMKRFFLIVQAKSSPGSADKSGSIVVEFKKLKCPGTFTGSEINLINHNHLARSYFYTVEALDAQILARRQSVHKLGKDFFLQRFRIPNLMKDVEKKFNQDLANFYGYYLGKLHAGSSSTAYRQAVWSEKNLVIEATKATRKSFYNEVDND
jgi:hypothetical protein